MQRRQVEVAGIFGEVVAVGVGVRLQNAWQLSLCFVAELPVGGNLCSFGGSNVGDHSQVCRMRL